MLSDIDICVYIILKRNKFWRQETKQRNHCMDGTIICPLIDAFYLLCLGIKQYTSRKLDMTHSRKRLLTMGIHISYVITNLQPV